MIRLTHRLILVAMLLSINLAVTELPPGVAQPQTVEDHEKSIANLLPEQRAYERYRYWVTQLPPADQQASNILVRYREVLKSRGFSDTDADAQIKFVRENGSRAEVELWNRALTAEKPHFNVNPNAFLVEMAKGRKPGAALDVGMGQGRNAIWLAQQGWDVTGFDPAEKAVALAEENAGRLGVHIKTEIKGMEEFDFGEKRWDLILLSYVGGREMPKVIERALKPGGVLVVEAFHRDATKGRSIGSDVVFDTGELPSLFPNLRVVRYEEPIEAADFGKEQLRLVRYCGVRPD